MEQLPQVRAASAPDATAGIPRRRTETQLNIFPGSKAALPIGFSDQARLLLRPVDFRVMRYYAMPPG